MISNREEGEGGRDGETEQAGTGLEALFSCSFEAHFLTAIPEKKDVGDA